MIMAVTIARYSKKYWSQTQKEDVAEHGSPQWTDYQDINEEDKVLRKEINDKFGFHLSEDGGQGFDGRYLYDYSVADNLCRLEESSTSVEYKTIVSVKKACDEKDLDAWSDLERYLIKNRFIEVKN